MPSASKIGVFKMRWGGRWTTALRRAALTIGIKSSSSSSEAASSESSQAPDPSPTAPYGRTLKGGRPTGDPRSKSVIRGHISSAYIGDSPSGKCAGSSCICAKYGMSNFFAGTASSGAAFLNW